jgi:TRAP-type C4-dicarboxylate transport system substrate-binding protein
MNMIGRFIAGGALAAGLSVSAAMAATWDMPTPYGDKTFHTVNIREFARDVEKATGGRLKINVHSAGSLIKHPEIKNAVRRGLVPIGEVLMSRLSNEDPVFAVDSIPFLASNYEEARRLWAASRPVIEKKLEKQGLKLLFAVPWPPQGIYAKKEIRKVEDLKGLKMRAYNASTEMFARLAGAVPTQVEVPDIPTAFSTGRVEAMITSPSTGANSKAWDFVKYFHHTQAWLPKNMVIVNAKAFARLPEDQQKAIEEAARRAEERGWQRSMKETEEKIDVLRKNGMVVVTPTPELMAGLKKIGEKMTEAWLKQAGADGETILKAYLGK